MFQILRPVQVNSWEPKPLNMEKVEHDARYITHTPQQDVCLLTDYDNYIEVVIYNEQILSSLHRFIIAPDYYWSVEEEEVFANLVQSEVMACSSFYINAIYEKYASLYPQWHLKQYPAKPLRMMDHIHQCQHSGTVKETLYKAGLDEIAVQIDKIEEYNLIGASPSDIFSGLNMRLLKAINIPEGILLIDCDWKRKKMLSLQNKYAWLFKEKWNAALCQYMLQLLKEEDDCDIIAKKLRKHYYKLRDFWVRSQWSSYIDFIHQKECVEEKLAEFLKRNEDDIDDLYIRRLYRYLIVEKDEWDEKIQKSNLKRHQEYEYEDDTFLIFFPRTIDDFVVEARKQRNCLMEYLDAYTENVTDLLLLRHRVNPSEPYVTVEIFDGNIRQAYTRFNRTPNEETKQWLQEYALCVGIGVHSDCFDEHFVG